MLSDNHILVGHGEKDVFILPSMANRHGLICGATGTGKTVTMKVMAESFSSMGVPVFLADIKGDVSGCARTGTRSEAISKRLSGMGMDPGDFRCRSFPCRFWDVFGEGGHPVRTTISEMGSELMSRLLSLSDAQTGVLAIVFRVADDKGWLLSDLKDLRAMVSWVCEHSSELLNDYGNVSKTSAGAIQRALLQLEDAGGNLFFGEPSIELSDWMQCDESGYGYINIFHCAKLYRSPLLYSTFMLWLLSELFEELPEVGDVEKPKLVFFFDEAHLLFRDAPKALVSSIEQVVKLIRSKGVGVYFVSQQPSDIPDTVLSQLGNKVQHALRAYTPAEIKSVKAAAQSFRENPAFDTQEAILDLGTGEAVVSFLDVKGRPGICERATIMPPQSDMNAIDDDYRQRYIMSDTMYGKYENVKDDRSAYEIINEEKGIKSEKEDNDTNKDTSGDNSSAQAVGSEIKTEAAQAAPAPVVSGNAGQTTASPASNDGKPQAPENQPANAPENIAPAAAVNTDEAKKTEAEAKKEAAEAEKARKAAEKEAEKKKKEEEKQAAKEKAEKRKPKKKSRKLKKKQKRKKRKKRKRKRRPLQRRSQLPPPFFPKPAHQWPALSDASSENL